MNHADFDNLVERETKRMKDVMCSKSADYSAADDKLFNFKLAAEVDGISPIEALRGMWLKHRTSLRQGLDELIGGKCRFEDWWIEKLTDDRNYSILLQALLTEKYFNNMPEEIGEFTIQKPRENSSNKGWYIILTRARGHCYSGPMFLHKDLTIYHTTGWNRFHEYGGAPGYYHSKKQAKACIAAYEKKFVCPKGWKIALNRNTDDSGIQDCGWFVCHKNYNLHQDEYLHKGGTLHTRGGTGKESYYGFGEAPGYWPTKEAAEAALAAYLEKKFNYCPDCEAKIRAAKNGDSVLICKSCSKMEQRKIGKG